MGIKCISQLHINVGVTFHSEVRFLSTAVRHMELRSSRSRHLIEEEIGNIRIPNLPRLTINLAHHQRFMGFRRHSHDGMEEATPHKQSQEDGSRSSPERASLCARMTEAAPPLAPGFLPAEGSRGGQ